VKSTGIAPLDIEAIMSILTAIAGNRRDDINPKDALLSAGNPGIRFAQSSECDNFLTPKATENAKLLLRDVKEFIRHRCSQFEESKLRAVYEPVLTPFQGLPWTAGGRDVAIGGQGFYSTTLPHFSCFTTNYDCAMESYLDGRGIEYESGFVVKGKHSILDKRRIHIGSMTWCLFKLHGSVDMLQLEDGSVVSTQQYIPGEPTFMGKAVREEVLIYPTHEKAILRYPFFDFLFEFVQALRDADIWLFLGFSFSDYPIVRLLQDEASAYKKMLVVAPDADDICKETLGVLHDSMQIVPVNGRLGDDDITQKIASKNKA